jgi:capsid protein
MANNGRGAIRDKDATMEWTAPRRALVDPTREIPALLKAVEGGVTSLQRATRQLGEDPEQILNEQIEDQVRWEPLKEKQAAPPPDQPQKPKQQPKEPS